MIGTPWTRARDEWVKQLTDADILRLIPAILKHYEETDETGGDHLETRESVVWLATRGVQGYEWGHVAVVAQELGLWQLPAPSKETHG